MGGCWVPGALVVPGTFFILGLGSQSGFWGITPVGVWGGFDYSCRSGEWFF